MVTHPPSLPTRCRHGSMWVSLCLILAVWTSAWPQDAHMHVAVDAGQLSVDLWEAPVREVLAAIGQQADLRVRVDVEVSRTMTAQFTAMDVEQGLRRLLRAASLSYALQYAPVPGAAVALHEIRVFSEAHGADRDSASSFSHASAGERASNDRVPGKHTQRPAILHTPAPHDEPMELESEESEPEASE